MTLGVSQVAAWAERRAGALHVPRAALLIAAAAVAFTLIWGLPFLLSPLSTDETYFALGARTILTGDQLYEDLWDIKPPLIYALYALPIGVAGEHVEAIRAFNLLNAALVTGAVSLATWRYFGQRAAFFATGLYAFSYFPLAGFDGLGEPESFMAAPAVLAFALYRTREDDANAPPLAFVSGLLLGVAVAIKFPAFLLVFGLPLAELIMRTWSGWSVGGALKRLTLAGLGFLLVQAAWIGYLVGIDAWSAFVDIQRNYTIDYNQFRWSGDVWYPRSVLSDTSWWLVNALYLTVPAWAALFFAFVRGPRPAVYLFASLTMLGIMSVWWQGKMFHYHWLIVVPFLAILAGYACDSLLDLLRPLGKQTLYSASALLLGAFLIAGWGPLLRTYDLYDLLVQRVDGRLTQSQLEDRYYIEFTLNRQLVAHVHENSAQSDSLYVWGFWTAPYWLADRQLPTRFVTNSGLRADWAPEPWRQELMSDLTRSPPRFIAVAAGDNMPWLTGTPWSSDQDFCEGFPELRGFVEGQYKPVLNNGLFTLYDREAEEAQAAGRCG
jgi:Dolichyl-phosphate-mannose-protein mannosyltransferase